MLTQLQNAVGDIGLLFIPDTLNLLDIDSDVINIINDRDIVIDSITFEAGEDTAEGLEDFTDVSMAELAFPTLIDMLAYMNTVFRAAHPDELSETFNLTADGYIGYRNAEGWARATIILDKGVFGAEFGEEFH